MRVLYAAASLLIITLSMALGLGNAPVTAAYKPQVLISHVQVRSIDSASHEAVTIFNNSEYAVDITNWCLHYTAAATAISSPPKGTSKVFCFDYLNDDEFLLLESYGSVTVFSKSYIDHQGIGESEASNFLTFSKNLSDSSGHLYLFDANSVEQDRVGWGGADYAAGNPADTIPSGSIILRKTLGYVYQDTGDNSVDFDVAEGSLYEIWTGNDLVLAFDICDTIPGIQFELPEGYTSDDDSCILIGPELGDGSEDEEDNPESGGNGGSGADDEAPDNLTDIEGNEYHQGIFVNEILPNPAGVDGGNEYIELYNSNSFEVDISGYILRSGVDGAVYSYYTIPSGVVIEPNGFWLIYSKDFGFNLANKSGQVSLLAGANLISQSGIYSSAPDNQAWALINGGWVYTKNLTPGSINTESQQSKSTQAVVFSSNLKPCAENQYRNPETNRCRLVITVSSQSTLTPCKEGQERNAETNRCRSISTAQSTLTPCKENQERNPETNRCRQVLSASIPSAEYPVEPITQAEQVSWVWWLTIGLAALGVVYAIWEWRSVIVKVSVSAWLKVRSFGQ